MNDELILEKVKRLPTTQKEQVLDFIALLATKNKNRSRPTFGSGKGTFEMPPDFDDPLDGFRECMVSKK
ncbi:MAG: DUF2281 domain-containing protein [Tunicatimonas sp.]